MSYQIIHLQDTLVPLTEVRTFKQALHFIKRKYPRAKIMTMQAGKFWTFNIRGKDELNYMDMFSIVRIRDD